MSVTVNTLSHAGGFASISGTVFNDLNHNGIQDDGETAQANITVYDDATNSGSLEFGDVSTTTDSNGHFELAQLNAGNYKIRQILPAGLEQTTPANGYGWTITLVNNQALSGKNFGEEPIQPTGGSITGTVFYDSNGDGIQNPAEFSTGGTVYSDANNNGKLDSGEDIDVTDNNGDYTLSHLPAGNYKIRLYLTPGFVQTAPARSFGWTLTLAANQSVTGKNFGQKGASIAGTVFNDTNGNRKDDGTEAALSGWEVYLDFNNDGMQDNGEYTLFTLADGSYSFNGLTAGNYIVRVIRPAGWSQTTPLNNLGQHVTVSAGQAKTNIQFGERQTG